MAVISPDGTMVEWISIFKRIHPTHGTVCRRNRSNRKVLRKMHNEIVINFISAV